MIVKYWRNGAFYYIDGINRIAKRLIDRDLMISLYDKEVSEGKCPVLPEEMYTPEGLTAAKVFFMAVKESSGVPEELVPSENLLDEKLLTENKYASAITLYFENQDMHVLVTNQEAYLMNDKGQTIERLV